MTDSPKAAPNPAQGGRQRFRVRHQSTAEIARRTGLAEHAVDRIVALCIEARFAKLPMPWVAAGGEGG